MKNYETHLRKGWPYLQGVLMAPERANRPADFHGNQELTCPFCPGHEKKLHSISFEATHSKKIKKWEVRVIKNKYPIVRQGYEKEGYGIHELVIETPHHTQTLAQLPEKHFALVLKTYQKCLKKMYENPQIHYVQLFKNQGKMAGASLRHAHSQIVGLSFVPKGIAFEIQSAQNYFHKHKRCLLCDHIQHEKKEKIRIVATSRNFTAFCPQVSQFPLECWILPTQHQFSFEEVTQTQELARLLKTILQKLSTIHSDNEYNLLLQTPPPMKGIQHCYHWSFRLLPRVEGIAGFEIATGLHVNVITPEQSTELLKDAKLH